MALKSLLNRFQYVSDLHIDKVGIPKIKAVAPNLLIAGDVANGWNHASQSYLKNLSKEFNEVVFVPGNHEFYFSSCYSDAISRMRETEQQIPNFTLLDNQSVCIDNITILGSTLWSNIPKHLLEYYSTNFYEYDRIPYLNPLVVNQLHKKSVDWIRKEISDKNPNNAFILMTHHAPLIEDTCLVKYNIPPNRKKYFNHAYCTDLSHIFKTLPESKCFSVFGHTHFQTSFTKFNSHFYSNPICTQSDLIKNNCNQILDI
jgi:Icc-related predicted phosphoesterase